MNLGEKYMFTFVSKSKLIKTLSRILSVDTPVYYFKTWWINIKLCFSYVGQVKSINVLNMNWRNTYNMHIYLM